MLSFPFRLAFSIFSLIDRSPPFFRSFFRVFRFILQALFTRNTLRSFPHSPAPPPLHQQTSSLLFPYHNFEPGFFSLPILPLVCCLPALPREEFSDSRRSLESGFSVSDMTVSFSLSPSPNRFALYSLVLCDRDPFLCTVLRIGGRRSIAPLLAELSP